jgi:2-keto-4-pentenoate hydratase/2-oxohepta-3-ene-1,7-dioic acid hydratase in catechol pathway
VKLATIAVETPVGTRRRVAVLDGAAVDDDSGKFVDVTTAYAAALAERGEADPLAIAEAHAPPDMVAFLERGERALDAARDALAFARETDLERGPAPAAAGSTASGSTATGGRLRFERSSVRLLAPVPRPPSFRDCMAFEEHVRQATGEEPPEVWYEQPIYYKGNPETIVGPGATVEWPDYSDLRDYELELAAVVGKRGQDVDAADGDAYVAGFTVLNDFSARDAQGREMEARLGPAKGKDFASAMGPYLVTADEFDVDSATMRAEVDGETWSEGVAGDMHHSFAEILEHVSDSEPLVPGDVIGSGTVGGGCGLELGQFLESGDTVALTIEGIGTLENTIE